jgi:hypothetical protein
MRWFVLVILFSVLAGLMLLGWILYVVGNMKEMEQA